MAFTLLILFLAWFAITSFFEKEKRAFGRSFLLLLMFIAMNGIFLLLPFSQKTWMFSITASLMVIFILWFLLSPAPKKAVEIVGTMKKIDERDVIFTRFDYEEGSQIFQDYYRRHPEFESIDREIRDLPDVLTSSHLKKDPVLFSLAAAEFDFLEHLLTVVAGKKGPKKESLPKEKNTQIIKSVMGYLGSNLCGICALNQAYVYSHVGRGSEPYGREIELDHKYAIVFAVEMDLAMISAAPKAPVIVETAKKYVEAAKISIIAAHFIGRLGFSARAHIAGSNYQVMLPPLGWEAGLGELGRLGILITSKSGPRARLGLITTDIPLIPDKPKVLGIQDFCDKCQKCARNCPTQAISYGKKVEENGVIRWVLNREECYRYWRKAGTDCAMCIYVCPYSKPDNIFHNFVRKVASTSSSAQTLSVWGDDFFYGRVPQRKRSPFSF
ncbi:MAG: 4Fe-4S dicluster domain-containing protein [Candidatus Aminicenantes bacterium]|nr:4Fe-4S dicluster domain-containing protein [Candidatus Aminicenantes bacterium]MDH5743044.1 4Fe-4S dicluster domain-containing protein [Candidatus Aminicenantes bacterium]